MKKYLTILAIAAVLATPLAASAQSVTSSAGLSVSVSASTTASASTSAGTKAKSRADQEITRRVANLNQLSARISQMVKLSPSEIAALQASLSAQVTNLTTLKAQIDAEVNLSALKTEVQSITKTYRIYMLILPQGRIAAAADRVETIVGQMQTISAKLSARISADTSGNASALQASFADFTAKIADANTQASAAVSETVSLQPDNGDTTVAAANTAALKDAHSKLQAATADLKAAAKDMAAIIAGVKGTGAASARVSATTSASAQ